MRARPNSRLIMSDQELVSALRAQGEHDAAIEAAVDARRVAQAARQADYERGVRSRADAQVTTDASALRTEIAAEAEEASRARGRNDGTPRAPTQDERMAGLATRTHNGTAWADMPVLHLLNAAMKHGDEEMAAYAEWKRTHR